MSLNRRAFLATLAAAASGALLDPERLVWVPGKTSYFDIQRPPVPDGWTTTVEGLLKRGDIITISGYYEPNPQGRQLTRLQEFVVIDPSNMDLVKLAPAGSLVGPSRVRAPKNRPVSRVWSPPVKGRRR